MHLVSCLQLSSWWRPTALSKGVQIPLRAVKYRDPKNAGNTWTGRGRMPRWLTAATKGGKAKKEDFLLS